MQYNKDTSGTNKGGNQTIYKEHTQQGYKDKYDYLVSKLNLLAQLIYTLTRLNGAYSNEYASKFLLLFAFIGGK